MSTGEVWGGRLSPPAQGGTTSAARGAWGWRTHHAHPPTERPRAGACRALSIRVLSSYYMPGSMPGHSGDQDRWRNGGKLLRSARVSPHVAFKVDPQKPQPSSSVPPRREAGPAVGQGGLGNVPGATPVPSAAVGLHDSSAACETCTSVSLL